MGLLRHRDSGLQLPLTHHMLVGRSREADLRIENAQVSAEHAVFMWDRAGWVVKDLASRNGTLVDGTGLVPGAWTPIREGSQVRFGGTRDHWTVQSADPPDVAALSLDSRQFVTGEDGQLSFPDAQARVVTENGAEYWLVTERSREPANDRDVIELAGQRWRLFLPNFQVETHRTETAEQLLLTTNTTIRFEVSPDEEHVQVSLVDEGGGVIPLRVRSFDYMLLHLARARRADTEAAAVAPGEEGWAYADELARGLGVDLSHLNVDIFRARRRFALAGLRDAAAAIERRPTTRQVRLGFGCIEIVPRLQASADVG